MSEGLVPPESSATWTPRPRILLVVEASDEVKAGLALALAAIPDAQVEMLEVPDRPSMNEAMLRAVRDLPALLPEIWGDRDRYADKRPIPAHLKQPGWRFGSGR